METSHENNAEDKGGTGECTNIPEISGVDTASAMSKTTTISTIAVQSGKTRIVIALLHCGDWLDLKVLEVTPDLASLGNTLQEALEFQKAHDEVLRQLQNKQSPVEELLRQADHLISTQKPRAEVYAAMAESLGRAWKDINIHLEFRKQILDLNVQYHTYARDFFTKEEELEAACKDTVVPIEIEAVKRFLTDIHEIRRALLEAHMNALQTGNSLIEKLKELGAKGTLDSRPDRIRTSVNRAISQVQEWMDELHTKRQFLETTFVKRKAQLEQCLALAILAVDLKEVDDSVNKGREALANSDELGDSSSSAELLLQWHRKLLPEAQQLQERALKITKATEQLEASGCFASEQAKDQAYRVLSTTSDYLTEISEHNSLLEKVINFFRTAQTAFTKLDQLEIQLQTSELPSTSPQLAKFHAQCAETIANITGPPIDLGHNVLREAKRGRGTEGVRKTVEELENRRITLENLCTAHREDKLRINRALNEFLEKHEDLYTWLKSIAEAFLQGHQDMGSDYSLAKDFLDLHNQLLNDLQTKGNEINSLLLTLPPILEYLEDDQRRDVDTKVESLHDHWVKLKNILEKRLDLASIYVKFHNEANRVNDKIDKLEDSLRANAGNTEDDIFRRMEEEWEQIVPLYQSAKNTGLTFINETRKMSEPHLDTKRACVCVESVLEKLSNRQVSVTRTWQTFKTDVEERREVHLQWEEIIMQSSKTLSWVNKLESQLYPVINTFATNPSDIIDHLERKQETVLPEIKRAQNEVEQRIKITETLISKSSQMDEQSLNIKNKLIELNQKLIEITSEYQILLQVLTGFFKNLTELDKTTENLNSQFGKAGLPKNAADVELLIREHEASRQAVLEMFRFTQNECESLKSRILQQEPKTAAEQDISKLETMLETRKVSWEEEWKRRRESLESQKKVCHFNTELQTVDESIDDLDKQLFGIKEQCRESQSSKSVAQTFTNFTRVTETLDIRVKNLVKEGENLVRENQLQAPQIQFNLNQIEDKWSRFKKETLNTSHLIELSTKYFETVNEADQWLKDGSRILVSVAKKTSAVKKPEEAQQLLQEVENFVKPGQAKQSERIQKISQLSRELFPTGWSKEETEIQIQHKEIIESFSSIISELHTLSHNLKLSEEQQERFKREQAEANEKLAVARAEAERAREAAKAAEEEKRAAEEAKRAAEDAKKAAEEAKLTAESAVKTLQENLTSQAIKEIKVTREEISQQTVNKLVPPVFISPLSDVVIQEGAKFTFMCTVSGSPTPVVTWYKDGISIQNNPDYQTSFEHGLCALTIEETFAEDSARYSCKAVNAAGSAETSAFLAVKEQQHEEQLIPPTFVKLLQPGFVKDGSKFQFECKVEGYPLPTVQWFKGNECIDNSPNYVITYNNGLAILKFEKATFNDKAEYTCKATNKLGIAQSKTNLNVEPAQPMEPPVFTLPLSNVMARAGQKIKLECEVDGVPTPVLIWTQNGKAVKESRDLKLLREGKRATLVISEAFPKDAGTFALTASNPAGEAFSSCNVTVKGRLPTETSDSELASDMEPIKPSIQVPLKDASVFEGQKVRLDCVIVGQPEPEVIWYRDDTPVKESSDFQLLFQGDRCSLIIQEAFSEDAGEYKVVALNSAGEASSKCRLIVTPLSEKQPALKPPHEEIETTGSSPKFSKLLSDVLVSENERVIFEATISGQPRPEIKWLLNNQEITATNRIFTIYDDQGNVSLRIDQVKPEDRGVYTVKAQNSIGEAKCFAQLIVKTVKPTEIQKPFEDIKSPPFFTERFTDRTVTEETSTKFECIVTGKPSPKVRWFFNDEPVSGKDFLVSTSGDRQVLTLPNVTKKSEGKITCIAENEAGTSTWSSKLTVRPPQEISSLSPKQNTEIQQHVESSYILKQEVESSSSIKKISSDAEPQVQTHTIKSHDEKSVTQINQEQPKVVESHKVEEYRSFADQPSLTHEKAFSSTITDKKVVKLRPPKFINPIMGKIVDQNTRVVLEGLVDGQPTPTVSWTKNGVELKSSNNVKSTFDLGRPRVEILNATSEDAGRYTCTAINEAGSAVSTSDLVVRKVIFPPVFGRRLQAQVVKKGERTRMEIEVTGTPEPTVTWYKDGNPLVSNSTQGRRILRQGNSHTLIIEKAEMKDQGKYMVRAVNEGGEAQSIADFAVYEPTPDTMMEVVKTVVFEDVRKHEMLSSSEDKTRSVSSTEQKVPVTIKTYDTGISTLPEIEKSVVVKKEVVKSAVPTDFGKKVTSQSSESRFQSSESKMSHFSESKSESKSEKIFKKEFEQQAPVIVKSIDSASYTIPDAEASVVSKSEIFKTSSTPVNFQEHISKKSDSQSHVSPQSISTIDSARYVYPDGESSIISKSEVYRSSTPYETEEKKIFQTSSSSMSHSHSSKTEKSYESSNGASSLSVPEKQKSQVLRSEIVKSQAPSDFEKKSHFESSSQSQFSKSEQSLVKKEGKSPYTISVVDNASYSIPEVERSVVSKTEITKTSTPFAPQNETISSESKSSQSSMFSQSQQSFMKETQISKESKVITLDHPTPELPEVPQLPKFTTRQVPVTHEEVVRKTEYSSPGGPATTEFKKESFVGQGGFETSSKQSTIDFSVKKIYKGGDTEVRKEIQQPSLYKRYEEVSKPIIENAYQTSSFQKETKIISSDIPTKFSQTRTEEEFILKPELPAEICYAPIPPTEDVSVTISNTESKISQPTHVESSSEENSFSSVKKHFQELSRKEERKEEIHSSRKFEKVESAHSRTRSASPKPSPQAIAMEKQWTKQKSFDYDTPPSISSSYSYTVERQTVPPRPLSSLSASSQEQTFEKTHEEKSYSTQSTLEKRWAPVERKYESRVEKSRTISEPEPPHYIAEVTGLQQHQYKQDSFQETTHSESKFMSSGEITTKQQEIKEDINLKPSQLKKTWPPFRTEEQTSTITKTISKSSTPSVHSLSVRPVSVQDITDEVYLEPGPPPEIGYAPPVERRQSYVELIEQDLEKNLEKEPAKVPAGAVRTIPPPLPPKNEQQQAPPLPAKPIKFVEPPKKIIKEVESKPFERFPDLEPFPFSPEPQQPKPLKVGPPPTPSKFFKGKFTDSDYESDIEAVRIPAKWKPSSSDTEEPSYKKVQPPTASPSFRSRSVEPEPLPPSKFDRPPEITGPPRPTVDFKKTFKRDAALERKLAKQSFPKAQEKLKHIPPPIEPALKPGSPPIFMEAPPVPKQKPESPKVKHKPFIDGYMADTDEPRTLIKKTFREDTVKMEQRSAFSSDGDYLKSFEQTRITHAPVPKVYKKHISSSTKKELVTTPIITNISTTETVTEKQDRSETRETYNIQTEVSKPKRICGPPPPSPSKFVKGEFRESDYESDYEGKKIPPFWNPQDVPVEKSYKSVRPILTPSGRHSQQSAGRRTPTPPTEFDNPPQISGPPRPKFEPIEKPASTIKLDKFMKREEKNQIVHKPKPVPAKPTPITDVIIATPAAPENEIYLQPGTPPEIGFAPGPQTTQYYKSTTSTPFHNAVQTETSNVVHFKESTENSQRTVSVQQTRKVITFGKQDESSSSQYTSEKRRSAPPSIRPKKFIPGEYRESDYESEAETTKIRPLWIPSESDNEEPRYRKVRPPQTTRSLSFPSGSHEESLSKSFSKDVTESNKSQSFYEKISKEESLRSQSSQQSGSSKEIVCKPGPRPSYGYMPERIAKSDATNLASRHMEDMTHSFKSKTQNFVSDIMNDISKKSTTTTTATTDKRNGETDAQVYREESRAAQYGTKHVDPDTGLIYFKYDFGYEFGIILPGEGKGGEIPVPKKTIIEPPKRSRDIEMPVYHETTKSPGPSEYKSNKLAVPGKTVRWEPTSESEMSEYETEGRRKGFGSRWEPSSSSPVSLSPSLPSTSPAFYQYGPGRETPTSTPGTSTPGSTSASYSSKKNIQPQRAPLFITPLRDIAVVKGTAARFECIVQSETTPTVLWSKDGVIITNNSNHQIFFRNGVCRLMIPQAYPGDAGTYSCTATNPAGAASTSATLQVPGERRSQYI